jgi:hypothetical protein
MTYNESVNMNQETSMKNLPVIASVILFVCGCAGNAVLLRPVDAKSMVHYSQLQGGETAPEKIESKVFYVDAGDTLPLIVTVKTNVVDTIREKIPLTVRRKTYFMIDVPKGTGAESREQLLKHMKLYISKDATHWVPIQNMKALKKMFGWKKGYLTLGFGISKEEGVFANIGVGTTDDGQSAASPAAKPGDSGGPAASQAAPGGSQP